MGRESTDVGERLCRVTLSLSLDYVIFSFVVLAAVGVLHFWLRRTGRQELSWTIIWLPTVAVLVGGWFVTDQAGQGALDRMREMVEGFPPTYAQETEQMGHALIGRETTQEDSIYQKIVAAQIRWEKANPSIADIYTMRKLPDGRNALVVDSETDYDRNGIFEGEREQRTAVWEIYDKKIPALEDAFTGKASFMNQTYSDRWGNWVSAFVPLRDRDGKIEGVLGVDFPAERWIAAIRRARWASMAFVLVFAVFLGAATTVIALLRADLRNRRAAEKTMSELNGTLERRVVERTAELEATHQRLLETSHRAGMAEVATGVLHNVGNVLTSVHVAANVVTEKMHAFNFNGLTKVCDLLAQREQDLARFLTEDPRGEKLRSYLSQSIAQFSREQGLVLDELNKLRKNIDHVAAVISMQQGFAKLSGVPEAVSLEELVEDAVRLNGAALGNSNLELIREYEVKATVMLQKHKAMQILVNMIKNARQACDGMASQPPKVRLQIRKKEDRIAIAVTDNGVGISPEQLPKLFTHGFTTRKEGHGFGLHSAAIAARELGGQLSAHSEGPGAGATFVLEIPAHTVEPAVA